MKSLETTSIRTIAEVTNLRHGLHVRDGLEAAEYVGIGAFRLTTIDRPILLEMEWQNYPGKLANQSFVVLSREANIERRHCNFLWILGHRVIFWLRLMPARIFQNFRHASFWAISSR